MTNTLSLLIFPFCQRLSSQPPKKALHLNTTFQSEGTYISTASPATIQIDICFSRCDMSMAQVNRCSSTRGTDDCSFKKFIKHNMTCSSKSVIRTQKAIFRFTLLLIVWQSSCPHDHNVHVSSILYGHETYAVYHSMVLCVRI